MLKRRQIAVLVMLMLVASLAAAPTAAQEADDPVRGQGTDDRDWVEAEEPDPTSDARFEFETEEHVKVAMRDGVHLDGKLYIPDLPEGEGPGPCILVANGYGWATFYEPRLADLASRGYATAEFSYRGVGESEGQETLYNKYGEDGYDLVEWMADQEWCDGNVGMFGGSLVGLNQWLTAKENPPSLKAIVPRVACGNCYEYLWYPGGTLGGPGRVGRGDPEYTHAEQHRNYDDWWRERTTIAEDHEAMAGNDIAVMAIGGWQDYISAGNVQAFEEFAAAGGEGKLIMDPGAHSDSRLAVLGPHHFNEHLPIFFDRYLRGEDHGVEDRGDALFYVYGAEQYRFEETWPIPDARASTLHLRAEDSGSIDSLNDGSLTAAAPEDGEASVSYSYDPEDGPFLPTQRQAGTGGITEAEMQPYEEQVSTWTTGALGAPTEVTGKFDLDFWASADAEDADFVLMVSDVAPDGSSTQVTSGYLSAPRNESRAEPDPLVPGEVRRYQLDTQPTSYVFDEGHRIRFSLAGASGSAPDVTLGQGSGPNPMGSNVTIYQDAERPSTVELPVIGTAVLPSELESRDDCMDGAWRDFKFRNQGQCVRYVETGQDSR